MFITLSSFTNRCASPVKTIFFLNRTIFLQESDKNEKKHPLALCLKRETGGKDIKH